MLFELCPIFLFWSLDSLDGGLKPEINTQMLSQFDNKKRSEPVDSHWCCKYFNKLYNSSLTSLCPISCHIFSARYPKKYRIGSRCGPFVHTSTSSFLNESTSPPGSVVLFQGHESWPWLVWDMTLLSVVLMYQPLSDNGNNSWLTSIQKEIRLVYTLWQTSIASTRRFALR